MSSARDKRVYCSICLTFLFASGVNCVTNDDSYLNALRVTHPLNGHLETGSSSAENVDIYPVYVQEVPDSHGSNQADVEHHYPPEYHQHFKDVTQSESASHDTSPVNSYVPPASGIPLSGPPVPISYGAPEVQRGPPNPIYGPPNPSYPPPAYPIGVYGPPHPKPHPVIAHEYYAPGPTSFLPDFLQNFATPHAFLSILDKIKWFKIDLFTIGKLILKLFLLKKFLAFFTILFLLLVIPSLKHKGKEDVGMMSDIASNLGMVEDDDDDDDDDDDLVKNSKTKRGKKKKAKMFINKTSEDLNRISSNVVRTIEKFDAKFNRSTSPTIIATDLHRLSDSAKNLNCSGNNTSVYCKSQSVLEAIRTIMPTRDSAESRQTTTMTTTTTPIKLDKHIVNLTSKNQLKSERHSIIT